jgi:hypothetical protein
LFWYIRTLNNAFEGLNKKYVTEIQLPGDGIRLLFIKTEFWQGLPW